MQVYYSGPNISRQLIPTAAFVAKPADNIKPTAPGGIIPVGVRDNMLAIGWAEGATDDQLITGYGIYVNGVLRMTSVFNGVSIPDIEAVKTYQINITAIDQAGNESPFSPTYVHQTQPNLQAGLKYKYYEGDWNTIPNFSSMTPLKQGVVATPNFSMRNVDDYFSVLFEGKIYIPEAGAYTFEISSDDGSRLYFNMPYSPGATPTLDNDGLHGDQIVKTATVTVAAPGYYPIAISYFEKMGRSVAEPLLVSCKHEQTYCGCLVLFARSGPHTKFLPGRSCSNRAES